MTGLRLRHVALINPPTPEFDALEDEAELSFVPLERVWPGRFDPSELRSKKSVATGYTRFRDGDIVVPKITPTFQADRTLRVHGLHGGVGAGTTELHVVRAGPTVEPRYVRFLLSTRPFLHGGTAEMIGVAGQKRVPDDWLRDLPVPVSDERKQARIADFLDAETARIDALIAAKQRMVGGLTERQMVYENVWLEQLARRFGEIPLKRLATMITVGIVVQPARWYAPSGIAALRGLNVRPGAIDLRDLVYLSAEGHAAHPKSVLRAGDVVVVRTGKAGAAAVVPESLAGANCIDLLLVRTGSGYDPGLLAAVINSERTSERIREQAVGTIQSHFNVGSLAQLLVPNAPVAEQRDALAHIADLAADAASLTSTLTRQIALLRERRQALITAAVTGELEI